MISLSQSSNGIALNGGTLKTDQNYVPWILTALLFLLKPKIFSKTLLMLMTYV